MNRDEIKQTLLLYRPGTSDAQDPEIAEALALAQSDPELTHWLEEHCARQNALRQKFRELAIPAGLKEQIISEQAARARASSRREKIVGLAAAVVLVVALAVIVVTYPRVKQPTPIPATLANYQSQMVYDAQSYYRMDLLTNNMHQIQSFLAQNQAPSDYTLPAGLQKAGIAGCAVEGWQKSKASMVCFLTGKPLAQGKQADLWLFVVDRSTVKDASDIPQPQFEKINGLMTATWTRDDKLYVLGINGDEQALKNYL